jgi:ATP-dependent helicase/nuclease subunit B
MAERIPRVVTIPSGVAFVDALAAGVLAELGTDPLALAQATILLPTRRACRALREAFLRASAGKPLLLPRLRPIGDVDEDELIDGDALDSGEEVPPAIDPVERHCLLTRLVLQREGGDPGLAARLAAALAQLLDSLETEEIPFSALAGIVPDRFAAHWQQTLTFLSIVGEAWPQILAARGLIDPASRRVRLIRALARRWEERPPQHPVYAAGSTGSIPASAALIGVVARLPRSRVVLPGLDRALDDAAWAAAGEDPAHPQFGLHQLLARLGLARGDVADWPDGIASPTAARARLLAAAMMPAARTADWPSLAFDDAAFAGIARLEAPSPQEEALAIALALRRALDTPGRTAALVTPDRGLARRVAAELGRWNVAIDDSAGRPLARTPPGVFFLLAARMVAEDFAPLPLLAALKHPLASLGLSRGAWLAKLRRLERRTLRGPRPAPGLAGLREAAIAGDAGSLLDWLDALAEAARPLAALCAGDAPAAEVAAAHVAFAERLSLRNGMTMLWAGEDGEALASFVAALVAAAEALGTVSGRAWPDLVESLMGGTTVRPRWGSHPRLAILGPLEARLLHADLVILGGLNEGGWPAEPTEDPWLSRPMRKAVGLPAPERRIGLSAHDFAQAAAARDVLLTRARKVEGAPTVKSRWWLRLDAMLTRDVDAGHGTQEQHFDPRWDATRDRALVAWAEALDAPPLALAPPEPPKPRPPVAARPRRLSVTQVETWVRDPYAVYARHVLKLRRLDPIDADIGALERGIAIHHALDKFISAHPGPLPEDAEARLVAEGEQHLHALLAQPAWRAFWWPRFVAAARWFVDFERKHRAGGLHTVATELKGELTLEAPAGSFLLTATADRIDSGAGRGAGLWIIDYKTGQAPSDDQVATGLAPQLPLEAAIAAAGGFPGVAAQNVAALAFIELRGGSPPGKLRLVEAERDGAALDAMTLAQEARENLERFIRRFDDPTTPYLSRPRPQWLKYEGDYDHLARVREWQVPR